MIPKNFNFVRSVGLNGGGAALTQGAMLMLVFILSHLFGPQGLAKFFITQNTVNTLAAAVQLGLGFTAMVFVARFHVQDPGYAKEIILFCQKSTLALVVTASIILAVCGHLIAVRIYGDGNLYPFVMLAAFATPFAALAMVQLNLLNGLQRYVDIFQGSAVSAAIMLTGAVSGGLHWGVLGAAAGFTISTIFRAMLLQYFIWSQTKLIPDRGVSNADIWKRIRGFAVPAGLAGLTLTPSTWISNALLLNYHGLKELGLFFAAMSVKTAISFLPQQIGSTFLPLYIRQSQTDKARAARSFLSVLLLMIATTIFIVGIIAFFGESIMSLFGRDFSASSHFLRILMIAVVFETASSAFLNRFAAQERMWSMLLLYTWPKDILLVVASFLMIPRWGGTGLSIAYLCSAVYGLSSYAVIAKLDNRKIFGMDLSPDVSRM